MNYERMSVSLVVDKDPSLFENVILSVGKIVCSNCFQFQFQSFICVYQLCLRARNLRFPT